MIYYNTLLHPYILTVLAATIACHIYVVCVFPTLVPLASFLSFEPVRYSTTYRPDDRALRRHTLYPPTLYELFLQKRRIGSMWIHCNVRLIYADIHPDRVV